MILSGLVRQVISRNFKQTLCCLLINNNMAKSSIRSETFRTTGSMSNFKPVTHVIFDMDGLILDTEYLYMIIRQTILREFGHDYDSNDNIYAQGRLSNEIATDIVEKFSLPISPEEFRQRGATIGAEVFSNVKLLPDTEIIYEKIISGITETYGKEYTSEIKLKVLGTNEQTTAAVVVQECELPISVDEFLVVFRKIQTEELGKTGLMQGAERLLRHLHSKDVPIAVATSSGKESVAVKTRNYQELFGLFHHIVMGSSDPEVKNGKPAPDIFRVCASRFPDNPSTDKCLVFEDAPNGVTGAVAAGMQTVMVPDPELPKERTAHATQVLKSLLDFKPEQFGLPPF